MTTSVHVQSAWQDLIAGGIDPYLNDPAIKETLLDPDREQPSIEASINHMYMLRGNHDDFFKAHDYDWAFERTVYDFGVEANWQARILQQLCTYWDGCSANQIRPDPVNDVVVRKTLTSRFDLATPSYRDHKGLHFVEVPGGFLELSLYLLGTLLHVAAGSETDGDDSWGRVFTKPADGLNPSGPPDVALETVARAIADVAKDWDPHAPDVGVLIGEQVPTFKTANSSYATGSLPTFVANASYPLADYAIAHEIGHRMREDAPIDPETKLEEYLAQELQADLKGFELFASSWGYRSEILDRCPLDEPGRILLGPLLFFVFSSLRGALLQSILGRRLELTRDKALAARLRRESRTFDVERKRAWAITEHFKEYAIFIKRRGLGLSPKDAGRLQSFAENTRATSEFINAMVTAIPEDDFVKALELADEFSPPF